MAEDAVTAPLFTPADAEGIVGVPRATARRWLEGYSYEYKGQTRRKNARLGPHAKRIDGTLLMSFLDLVEVKLARRLRKQGVSWARVNEAAALFRTEWGSEHPFALRRLRSDGRKVFAEIGQQLKDPHLLQIGTDQFVFDAIVDPSLFDVLDFREDGVPFRLWPLGRDGQVVVDPSRAFGQPVLDRWGVPTSVLAAAYAANDNSASKVAAAFELPVEAVEAALRFAAEARLAA